MSDVAAISEPSNSAPKKPLRCRLSELLRGASREKQSPRSELIQQLDQLFEERKRVRRLIAQEEERAAELAEALARSENARIDALAKAKLSGTEADQAAADELMVDAVTYRRSIAEANAVAGKLQGRVSELTAEIEGLRYEYRRELSAFLERLYAEAMERYNALAPELAAAVVEVAAVRRVMMSRRQGNTNGWGGEILLPAMRPGDPRAIPPILDGATQSYDAAANKRAQEINEAVHGAGFTYGLE